MSFLRILFPGTIPEIILLLALVSQELSPVKWPPRKQLLHKQLLRKQLLRKLWLHFLSF
jgi:hypothetical protein